MNGLALHRAGFREPPSRLRIAAAVLVLGAALAGAALLYSHRQHSVRVDGICGTPVAPIPPGHCLTRETRSWATPTALGVAFLGLAVAGGILVAARRRT